MAHDNLFYLQILSPQGTQFDGLVLSASFPTIDGTIAVLRNHMPLLAKLIEGEIEIRTDEGESSIVVGGGFLEVTDNTALVLADYAVRAESIETAKVEEKKRQAELALREKRDYKEFTGAEKALRLSSLELKVSEKIRKKRNL